MSLTRCQPIAVRDVIKYLIGCLEHPGTTGRSFDIGSEDILSYEQMLHIFAGILEKRILFISSPVSNIPVYAYLASLLTPVPHAITRCLLESSGSEVVCQETNIRKLLPFKTLSYRESVVLALSREIQDRISTRWSDAYPPAHELSIKLHEVQPRPHFIKSYSLFTDKSPIDLFDSICQIGGRNGWFNNNWMWKLRGWVDRVLMGVGTSRGRKSRSRLHINDVIDFWRIEDLRPPKTLLLRAEMKIPGRAWLQFDIEPEKSGNRLSVTAFYDAQTWAARLYWYCFLPFHSIIFNGLIRQIESRSGSMSRSIK